MSRTLDVTDFALLSALREDPRASHADLARRVGVARGTIYSRLDRLERDGVIVDYAPTIDPSEAGLTVSAFTTLEIDQGSLESTLESLAAIVEVVEIHTVTGPGDLLCRIMARSNRHLHEVLQAVAAIPAVQRSTSQLVLFTSHRRTALDVLVAD